MNLFLYYVNNRCEVTNIIWENELIRKVKEMNLVGWNNVT